MYVQVQLPFIRDNHSKESFDKYFEEKGGDKGMYPPFHFYISYLALLLVILFVFFFFMGSIMIYEIMSDSEYSYT